MKITIPRIVRPLALGDYASEMAEFVLNVWVNPDRKFTGEFIALVEQERAIAAKKLAPQAEDDDRPLRGNAVKMTAIPDGAPDGDPAGTPAEVALSKWYSTLLSQGPDETRVSEDDLREMFEQDPALWAFIVGRCWEMIDEHRTALEKKSKRP